MTPIRLKSTVAATLLSILVSGNCAAGVIAYSNDGPPRNTDYSGFIVGSFDPIEVKLAQRFTPTTSGQLSKLELLMNFRWAIDPGRDPNRDELTLRIVPDENGAPGSTDLWSQVYVDQARRSSGFPDYSSFDVDNGIMLQEGTRYWITATTISESSAAYKWYFTKLPINEPRATYYIRGMPNGRWPVGQWIINQLYDTYPIEFGLRVSVVPEPAAAALMLAASATLLAVRRRTASL